MKTFFRECYDFAADYLGYGKDYAFEIFGEPKEFFATHRRT